LAKTPFANFPGQRRDGKRLVSKARPTLIHARQLILWRYSHVLFVDRSLPQFKITGSLLFINHTHFLLTFFSFAPKMLQGVFCLSFYAGTAGSPVVSPVFCKGDDRYFLFHLLPSQHCVSFFHPISANFAHRDSSGKVSPFFPTPSCLFFDALSILTPWPHTWRYNFFFYVRALLLRVPNFGGQNEYGERFRIQFSCFYIHPFVTRLFMTAPPLFPFFILLRFRRSSSPKNPPSTSRLRMMASFYAVIFRAVLDLSVPHRSTSFSSPQLFSNLAIWPSHSFETAIVGTPRPQVVLHTYETALSFVHFLIYLLKLAGFSPLRPPYEPFSLILKQYALPF